MYPRKEDIMLGIIIDGNKLDLVLTSVPVIPTTKRIIDTIDVDGREGSLTLLKGWEDLTITFKAAIHDKSKWDEVLPTLLNA